MLNANIYIRIVIHANSLPLAEAILMDVLSQLIAFTPNHTPLVPYEEEEHFETKVYGLINYETREELKEKISSLKEIFGRDWLLHNKTEKDHIEEEWLFNYEAFILHESRFRHKVKWALLHITA